MSENNCRGQWRRDGTDQMYDIKGLAWLSCGLNSFLKTLSPVQTPNFSWTEPNTLNQEWIKYMKSSASESIRNAYLNLELLSRSFRLARPGISTVERLWNGFDSDAELFMYRT